MFGTFSQEKSAHPQRQSAPPSVGVCNQHALGPFALDPSKARQRADLARSRRRDVPGLCAATWASARHRAWIPAPGPSALRTVARASGFQRPPESPGAPSAGSRPGAPSAPSAPARPACPGVQRRGRAEPGSGAGGQAGAGSLGARAGGARAEVRGAVAALRPRSEGRTVGGRRGSPRGAGAERASGAAEPSEFAPEPVLWPAAPPAPARRPCRPRRRRPRGDVGCWWAPGSSGGGGSLSFGR